MSEDTLCARCGPSCAYYVLHVLCMSVWCVLHVWQGVERWDGCYHRFFSYTTTALFHLADAEPERAFDQCGATSSPCERLEELCDHGFKNEPFL